MFKQRCVKCTPTLMCRHGFRKGDCTKCRCPRSYCKCGIRRSKCHLHASNRTLFCSICGIFAVSPYKRENGLPCGTCARVLDKRIRVEHTFLDLFLEWGYHPTAHDKVVRDVGCEVSETHEGKPNLRRMDYFFRLPPTFKYHLVVECDEFSHRGASVDCEMKRLQDVSDQVLLHGDIKPLAVVRFNPYANGVEDELHETLRRAFAGKFEVKDARGFEVVALLGYSEKRIQDYNESPYAKRQEFGNNTNAGENLS